MLCAFNRQSVRWDFKWVASLIDIDGFAIHPQRVIARLYRALEAPPHESLALYQSLAIEAVKLVGLYSGIDSRNVGREASDGLSQLSHGRTRVNLSENPDLEIEDADRCRTPPQFADRVFLGRYTRPLYVRQWLDIQAVRSTGHEPWRYCTLCSVRPRRESQRNQ